MRSEKAVFITGGGSGLGAEVALLLARDGWRIGLAGRRETALEATRQRLLDAGHAAQCFALDVADFAAVEQAIHEFAPTAVVNSAAVLGQGDIMDSLGPEQFAAVQAINVNGSFNTCCAAMRWWHSHKQPGDIVNISSLSGIRGMQAFPGFSAYAASKHALVGLTEALAQDGRAHAIRVNAIAPGMMRTDMLAQLGITASTLPQEIAPTVAFLLDRRQSGPITGTTIEIHCND